MIIHSSVIPIDLYFHMFTHTIVGQINETYALTWDDPITVSCLSLLL